MQAEKVYFNRNDYMQLINLYGSTIEGGAPSIVTTPKRRLRLPKRLLRSALESKPSSIHTSVEWHEPVYSSAWMAEEAYSYSGQSFNEFYVGGDGEFVENFGETGYATRSLQVNTFTLEVIPYTQSKTVLKDPFERARHKSGLESGDIAPATRLEEVREFLNYVEAAAKSILRHRQDDRA